MDQNLPITSNAPINVKPEGGGGGGWAIYWNSTVTPVPWVGTGVTVEGWGNLKLFEVCNQPLLA